MNSALLAVKNFTKSDETRLQSMVNALDAIRRGSIVGDIVEVGVWRGGNIMLARMLAPERICWMYDTFDGMTVPDEKWDVKRHGGETGIDRYRWKTKDGKKWDAVSVQKVAEGFSLLGLDDDRKLNYVVGKVEETVRYTKPNAIAILRLDVNWYLPTQISLEVLYPLLSIGGFLIVDDYGHWMGCKKAVDEYFGKAAPPSSDVDYSCRVYCKV